MDINTAEGIKVGAAAVCGFLFAKMSALGPLLLVLCLSLLGDYVTGLIKAGYKNNLNSKIGLWGIVKKLLYLVIVAVAVGVDWLIVFLGKDLGLQLQTLSLFSILVAVWLTINEWISILENVTAVIGKNNMPKFLMPLVKLLKTEVENKTDSAGKNKS